MSLITTQVVKHSWNVIWYLIFQVAIIVSCSLILTSVVAVISYFSILWVIKLFKANMTLFRCPVSYHPDGTCMFIFSVYGALTFFPAFILFTSSLYRSSTGFKNTFKICIQHKWNLQVTLSFVKF